MNLLNIPKKLYFQWIDGFEMNVNELTTIIDDSIDNAEKLRLIYQKLKMYCDEYAKNEQERKRKIAHKYRVAK